MAKGVVINYWSGEGGGGGGGGGGEGLVNFGRGLRFFGRLFGEG